MWALVVRRSAPALRKGVIAALLLLAVSCAFQTGWAQRWIEPISPIPDGDVTVVFSAGSAALTEIAKATLDRQAAVLRAYPRETAVIYGHADPREAGSSQGAWDLALARAIAARNYLIAKGVSPDRLRPDSRGCDFVLMIREPTEDALAGMRFVSTEVVERSGHWSNRGY